MNLQPQAEAESERRTRSKLETHRKAIFALRRKHWSYGQIAEWLNEHGVANTNGNGNSLPAAAGLNL